MLTELHEFPLSISNQIYILEAAKKNFIQRNEQLKYGSTGLCSVIQDSIIDLFNGYIHYPDLSKAIPIFTRKNASKFSLAYSPNVDNDYWWPLKDTEARVEFLDWMITELKTNKAYSKKSIWKLIFSFNIFKHDKINIIH